MVEKILIVKTGAIGDVLMTTPFVRELYSLTGADIYFYVGHWSKVIIEKNPYVKKTISFQDSFFQRKKIFSLIRELIKLRRYRFANVYILHRHLFYYLFFSFLNTRIIGFRQKLFPLLPVFSRDKFPEKKHHVDAYLSLLPTLKSHNKSLDFKIDESLIGKKVKNKINDYLELEKKKCSRKFLLAINPGGGSNPGETVTVKQWGEEKYIELINQLNDQFHQSIKIFLTGGLSDSDLCENIFSKVKIKNNVIDASGEFDLLSFGYFCGGLNLFITGDTGGMHLAAACRVPVLSIFGPTDPLNFAPTDLLEKSPLDNDSRYIQTKVSCSPCYRGKFKGCREPVCMNDIQVSEVYRATTHYINAF